MNSQADLISVPEAAQQLGCSDVWVLKMVRAGALEGFKLSGRAWAITRKSVEKNIREYEQRDPSQAGRKREGSRVALAKVSKAKTKSADATQSSKATVYYSAKQVAESLECGSATVRRAAKRAKVGIYVAGGRLVALSPADIEALKPYIHETSGNPNWIAARGKGEHSRSKPTRSRE